MENKRIERPPQTVKNIIKPLSESTKIKIAAAFQAIVNRIKEKHL